MLDPIHARPHMIVRTATPLTRNPPRSAAASLITPRQDFYVRSHGDIPALDEATHRTFRVRGQVRTPFDLTVKELRARFRSVRSSPSCSAPATAAAICSVCGRPRAIRGRPERSATRNGPAFP